MTDKKPPQPMDEKMIDWANAPIPTMGGRPDTKAERADLQAGYDAAQPEVAMADLREKLAQLHIRWYGEHRRAAHWRLAAVLLEGEAERLHAELLKRPPVPMGFWKKLQWLLR